MTVASGQLDTRVAAALPVNRDLYYGGAWHRPNGGYLDTIDPATGLSLGPCAEADASDVDAAVAAAEKGFLAWRDTKPVQRSVALRAIAQVLRDNAEELALIDAANCGNPVKALIVDIEKAAVQLDFFAGVATEAKGATIPAGADMLCMTVREPWGVCARIVAYNHPLLFAAAKLGAPIAAGNSVIIKPPHQAPLSALRMMELIDGILPPGVANVVTGTAPAGSALVAHPRVPVISLIGSIPTGRAVAKACAERMKHVLFELSGKNALIVYPDADIGRAVNGAIQGMNFTWCGQSCGSTSRLFVHDDVYDAVVEGVLAEVKRFRPGLPCDMNTNMGAIISRAQHEKILGYIDIGKSEGAKLLHGGGRPPEPELSDGWFVEPTVFGDVNPSMRIACEEIFGPVLSIIRWSDEAEMLKAVNNVEYGLTAAVYSQDISRAHRAARAVEAGFVWINDSSSHYVGAPFGGYKQSGTGREESIEELLEFTQVKTVKLAL